jgi:raffinose/stachyose/melibiose transport system permease protein
MRLVGSAARRRHSAGAGPAADRAGRRALARRRQLRQGVEIGLFVSPALALYLLFVLLPLVVAAYYSLYHWSGLGSATDFVGLGNYVLAFQDDVFRKAILHNFTIVGLSLVVQLPLGLGAALLLNRRFPGRAALRLVFFAPYVLSEAITAIIWLLMLQPDGLVDQLLRGAGLGGLVHLWLADLRIVLYTMFVVITWKYLGFGIILFLAGLQGIPDELLQAAAIDGAGELQSIRHVTLPLLGPTIRIWGFLSIIGSLQLFDLVWLTTLGGPANSSNTMAVYLIDHGFRRYQFGYGSAASVILFVIALVVALMYQQTLLRRDTEGAMTRMVG